jgi:cytochrome c oxidase subunit 4
MNETHPVVGPRTYVTIYVALLFFTYLTWQVAYYDLGRLNAVVALTIAAIKASLVVVFFMHARYSSRLTWVAIAAGVFWLAILLALTFGDYLTRAWIAT